MINRIAFQRHLYPNLQNLWTLPCMTKGTFQMWFKIPRWGVHPRLPRWTPLLTLVKSKNPFQLWSGVGVTTVKRTMKGIPDFEDARENREMWAALKIQKRERCIFSQSLRNAALSKLWVDARETCAGFWPPEQWNNKLVMFQARVCVFVTAADDTGELFSSNGRNSTLDGRNHVGEVASYRLPFSSDKLSPYCLMPVFAASSQSFLAHDQSWSPAVWTQGPKYKAKMNGKPGLSRAHEGGHIL